MPEHRRVLRQGHGDVHDHGRHLHAPLPVLRRRARPPASARRRRAASTSRRRSRRCSSSTSSSPAWTATTCATAARSISSTASARCASIRRQTQIEVLVPDFRGRLERALDDPRRGAAGRDEPQPRNRAAAVQAGAPRLRLRAFAALLREFKARCPGVPTKSGLMVGLGETDDEILRGDARHARTRHRHADDRPVPAAVAGPPAGAALRASRHVRACSSARRTRWASGTRPWARWCARPITPTSRRKKSSVLYGPTKARRPPAVHSRAGLPARYSSVRTYRSANESHWGIHLRNSKRCFHAQSRRCSPRPPRKRSTPTRCRIRILAASTTTPSTRSARSKWSCARRACTRCSRVKPRARARTRSCRLPKASSCELRAAGRGQDLHDRRPIRSAGLAVSDPQVRRPGPRPEFDSATRSHGGQHDNLDARFQPGVLHEPVVLRRAVRGLDAQFLHRAVVQPLHRQRRRHRLGASALQRGALRPQLLRQHRVPADVAIRSRCGECLVQRPDRGGQDAGADQHLPVAVRRLGSLRLQRRRQLQRARRLHRSLPGDPSGRRRGDGRRCAIGGCDLESSLVRLLRCERPGRSRSARVRRRPHRRRATTGSATTPSSRKTAASACSRTSSVTTSGCRTSTTPAATSPARTTPPGSGRFIRSGSYGSTGIPSEGIGSKPVSMSAYEKIFLDLVELRVDRPRTADVDQARPRDGQHQAGATARRAPARQGRQTQISAIRSRGRSYTTRTRATTSTPV